MENDRESIALASDLTDNDRRRKEASSECGGKWAMCSWATPMTKRSSVWSCVSGRAGRKEEGGIPGWKRRESGMK